MGTHLRVFISLRLSDGVEEVLGARVLPPIPAPIWEAPLTRRHPSDGGIQEEMVRESRGRL